MGPRFRITGCAQTGQEKGPCALSTVNASISPEALQARSIFQLGVRRPLVFSYGVEHTPPFLGLGYRGIHTLLLTHFI
jgi:hypothetical protein